MWTLVIAGEKVYTTYNHLFYVDGRWLDAADLQVGDDVRRADGTTGEVQRIEIARRPQVMYNLSVAEAHTFFVGEQQWLVHNCGDKVYRNASGTPDSLTPRPGKDDLPGGGISFWSSIDKLSPGKYVEVATGKLKNLVAVLDNPRTGHVSIHPKSLQELVEWASSRGSGTIHELTQELLDAVVNQGVK